MALPVRGEDEFFGGVHDACGLCRFDKIFRVTEVDRRPCLDFNKQEPIVFDCYDVNLTTSESEISSKDLVSVSDEKLCGKIFTFAARVIVLAHNGIVWI